MYDMFVTLLVSNTGIDVSEEQLVNMFDMFATLLVFNTGIDVSEEQLANMFAMFATLLFRISTCLSSVCRTKLVLVPEIINVDKNCPEIRRSSQPLVYPLTKPA